MRRALRPRQNSMLENAMTYSPPLPASRRCRFGIRRHIAMAQWPTRNPIRRSPCASSIGFPAGGPNDILGRIIAQWLSRTARPAVRGREQGGPVRQHRAPRWSVRAPADGYTVLLCGPANAISGSLYPNLPFNFLRDIDAGRRHHPRGAGDGGASVGAGEDRAGVPRLRQGQSRQDQDGVDRQRQLAARHRRAVQADDRAARWRSCTTAAAGRRSRR